MPETLAAALEQLVRLEQREKRVGAAVLTNSTTATVDELTLKLIARTVEARPVAPKAWRVEAAPLAEVEPLFGIWWVEGSRIVFRWRAGKLEGRFAGIPDWKPSSVFEREGADRWRTVSGHSRARRCGSSGTIRARSCG